MVEELRSQILAAVLFLSLVSGLLLPQGASTLKTSVSIWSEAYSSFSIMDASIADGSEFSVEVNADNVPRFVGGTATGFNGLDITITYDATLIRVSASNRLIFDAGGEDTVVSVSPVREPSLAEKNLILTPFPDGNLLSVRAIDIDGNSKHTIGETLVFDADDDSIVDATDTVVNETPTRAPTGAEIGRPLLDSPNLGFNDADSSGTYDFGELLAFDILFDGLLSKPSVGTGPSAFALPTCHFYEGCVFDTTVGTPLEGRTVTQLAKACDAGCTTITPGGSRLALVLLGAPIQVPASGLSGTLFMLQFKTQGSPTLPVSGSSVINIQTSTLTSPPTGPIPHIRLNGFFSNTPNGRGISVVSVLASKEELFRREVTDITVTIRNVGTQSETVTVEIKANTTLLTQASLTISSGSSGSLLYSWNTSDFEPGKYLLNATAPLAADPFPQDNSHALEQVTVLGFTDAAIAGLIVEEADTGVPVVAGRSLELVVVVKNEGAQTNSMNVTVYYDGTKITSVIVQNVVAGTTRRAVLGNWDTTGISAGTYTMSANITKVAGEVDLSDNSIVNGTVSIISSGTDISVIQVTHSVTAYAIVGDEVSLTVVLENQGSTAENLDVDILVNNTLIGTRSLSLAAFTTSTPQIQAWNTSGFVLGAYLVNATVRITGGASDIDPSDNRRLGSTPLMVRANKPPNVQFTIVPAGVLQPGTTVVIFDGSFSLDPDDAAGDTIQEFQWYVDNILVLKGQRSIASSMTRTFPQPGVFVIALTVVDRHNGQNSTSRTIRVNAAPSPDFSITPSSTSRGTSVTFDASASTDDTQILDSGYEWDFGDGTSGTGRVVTHAYNNAGTFTVKLTITDSDGVQSTVLEKQVTVADDGILRTLTESAPYIAAGLLAAGVAVVLLLRRRSKVGPATPTA